MSAETVQGFLFLLTGGGVIIVCIRYAGPIAVRMYLTRKFSRPKVALVLNLRHPRPGIFTLAILMSCGDGKNSEILSFYYYWLLLGEISTHLFTFGTFVVLLCLASIIISFQ